MEIKAYTDGACSGNPGPGGWGVVIIAMETGQELKRLELSGGAEQTTNNRMELTAAIQALEALERPSKITIYTDSVYVKDGILKWLANWKLKGWKTASKKPVKNVDLWRALDLARLAHQVTWEWVKGHDGVPENERADFLARKGMSDFIIHQKK
jgi:ribonuclease HI